MKTLFIILTVLSSFMTNIEKQTLKSDFVVTISETATQPLSYTGSFVMRGERFELQMMQMEIAYDGKTLYMYSAETDEIQLTEPTQEELLQANPLAFAKSAVNDCEVLERDKSNGEKLIVLVPRDKTKTYGIGRIEVVLMENSPTTNYQLPTTNHQSPIYLPVSVELKEGKRTTTLKLKNAEYISTTPTFKINKPGAFVNDLR